MQGMYQPVWLSSSITRPPTSNGKRGRGVVVVGTNVALLCLVGLVDDVFTCLSLATILPIEISKAGKFPRSGHPLALMGWSSCYIDPAIFISQCCSLVAGRCGSPLGWDPLHSAVLILCTYSDSGSAYNIRLFSPKDLYCLFPSNSVMLQRFVCDVD